MKYRMLLVLILICAILVAAAGGTLSYYYSDSTAFGFDIEPDTTPTPTPTPTPQSSISVLYQTTQAWEQGHSGKFRFNYSITITNNSDQPIVAWYIRFTLSQDTLTSAWSAVMTKHLPAGSYEFVNPAYNNPATDNIAPGQSVTFGGEGQGRGQTSPQNVQVGGSNTALTGVVLTCQFGLQSLQQPAAPQASSGASIIKVTPPAPEVSGEVPGSSDMSAPDATDTPSDTSSPDVTDTPGDTSSPGVTDTPGGTSSPGVTDTPGDTGVPQ